MLTVSLAVAPSLSVAVSRNVRVSCVVVIGAMNEATAASRPVSVTGVPIV